MEKINVAELLKACPKGMELDCTMYEDVYFDYVDEELNIIYCYLQYETHKTSITFTQYGTPTSNTKSKCVIFPKGKTTWKGFQRPFKDGDILSYQYKGFKNRTIYIYMQHSRMNTTYYVALSGGDDLEFMVNDKEGYALNGYNDSVRFATEEEKQKLFDAIKENGYKWNAETKTLEKLVEPKFKVGDRINHKRNTRWVCTITRVDDNRYYVDGHPACYTLPFGKQNEYELIPNKFDITTLKPFESRVLVRSTDSNIWLPAIYGFTDSDRYYAVGGFYWKQCITYEGNEHLLGTAKNCDEFYKTWE